MPHAAYPAAADLTAFLAGTGLDVPDSLDLQDKCDEAAAEWESRVGWFPYLATDTTEAPSTRLFDPPGPAAASGRPSGVRGGKILCLEGGLLSLTSLSVGVVPDGSGDYDGAPGTQGSLLTNNLNFFLRPQNAAARGLAWTEVEFLCPIRGVPQSVAVAGVWGRVTEIGDDVWNAVRQYAAFLAVPELQIAISSGLVKIDDAQYASGADMPLPTLAALWEKKFLTAARRKKRIVA